MTVPTAGVHDLLRQPLGCRVTANQSSCRRPWPNTRNANRHSNVRVGTTPMLETLPLNVSSSTSIQWGRSIRLQGLPMRERWDKINDGRPEDPWQVCNLGGAHG
jgi:hypothetical protein